jgi:hypothetical protein
VVAVSFFVGRPLEHKSENTICSHGLLDSSCVI